MRKVKYFEYERKEGSTRSFKVEKGEAVFHCFGSNYEEFESGPGNYTTAVIELPDGKVMNIPVEQIEFVQPSDVVWITREEMKQYDQQRVAELEAKLAHIKKVVKESGKAESDQTLNHIYSYCE